MAAPILEQRNFTLGLAEKFHTWPLREAGSFELRRLEKAASRTGRLWRASLAARQFVGDKLQCRRHCAVPHAVRLASGDSSRADSEQSSLSATRGPRAATAPVAAESRVVTRDSPRSSWHDDRPAISEGPTKSSQSNWRSDKRGNAASKLDPKRMSVWRDSDRSNRQLHLAAAR